MLIVPAEKVVPCTWYDRLRSLYEVMLNPFDLLGSSLVPPGNVMIIGAGVVGLNAVKIAVGLGADVSILDVNVDRLRHVDDIFLGQGKINFYIPNAIQYVRYGCASPRRLPSAGSRWRASWIRSR